MKTILFTTLVLGFAGTLSAHNTWFEARPEGGLVIRYGDYGQRLEKSPGVLDNVDNLRAWRFDTNGTRVKLKSLVAGDGIAVAEAEPGSAAFTSYISHLTKAHGGGPETLRTFCTRWQPAGTAATACLTLDILPDAKGARIVFRGRPLSGAKAKIYGPAVGAEYAAEADAEGRIAFKEHGGGLTLVRVTHAEVANGFHEGQAYSNVGFVTTLSLVSAAK